MAAVSQIHFFGSISLVFQSNDSCPYSSCKLFIRNLPPSRPLISLYKYLSSKTCISKTVDRIKLIFCKFFCCWNLSPKKRCLCCSASWYKASRRSNKTVLAYKTREIMFGGSQTASRHYVSGAAPCRGWGRLAAMMTQYFYALARYKIYTPVSCHTTLRILWKDLLSP